MSSHPQQPLHTILPGPHDSIRVVPLHQPEQMLAPPASTPLLTYRGGPLLSAVEVFTIFWGPSWQQPPQNALISTVNQFFDFILTSALIDQLAEYNVAGTTIGHGRRVGTVTINAPHLARSLTDSAIQHMLQQELSTNAAFPRPNANTLYFLYLPPGVTISMGGSRSCQAFCGYHSHINGKIFYAVMPDAGCKGCLGGLSSVDALIATSSHELCEAITDPVPGQGWYDDANGEIGDICAWKTKKVGNYTVQLEWSNQTKSCR
ncbi:MAG: hypothetical protein NVS4B8_04320 [Herpetosiphon sp.]